MFYCVIILFFYFVFFLLLLISFMFKFNLIQYNLMKYNNFSFFSLAFPFLCDSAFFLLTEFFIIVGPLICLL